jgi:hypothetical protein
MTLILFFKQAFEDEDADCETEEQQLDQAVSSEKSPLKEVGSDEILTFKIIIIVLQLMSMNITGD